MKKTLKEQIERIHTLTYGNPILKEGFIDDLLGKNQKKVDEPNKADFVSTDVKDFYTTIEKAIDNGGLKQQSYGTMMYQKEVESMQIGLMLLGFDLPKHGVDGLFGPETAAAVQSFKQKYGVLKEASEEIRNTLDDLGYDEKGNELSSAGEVTDELTNIVTNVLKDYKEAQPSVNVTITGGNDKFHKGLGYKSKHTDGQAVDLVIKPYNTQTSKAFTDILDKYKGTNNKFAYIDEYKNPSNSATGGHFHLQFGDNVATTGGAIPKDKLIFASPEMLTKLLELLKEKNVTSEQLKQYIDKTISYSGSTDKEFYESLLKSLEAPVTDENMKFLYAWRQAEGKGGNYNPFNTTWDIPGSVSMNSAGVKSYKSAQDGLTATVKTLKMETYRCIVDGLKNNIGADKISRCESLKTWGTGDLVAKVVSSYNSGANPNIKSLA